MKKRNAFTLVELLVVIGIIAVLIAMLLPALKKVRESAYAVKCQSNMRSLVLAFQMFGNDHNGYLPGNKQDGHNYLPGTGSATGPWPESEWWKRDFLGVGQGGENLAQTPMAGTIYQYIKNKEVYRCPSQLNNYGVGTGADTNGHFDYACFESLTGAKANYLKSAWYIDATGKKIYLTGFPILCEENPKSVNGGVNMEGGHSESDQLSHEHKNGSYVAMLDGTLYWLNEHPNASAASSWYGKSPHGQDLQLGKDHTFGWWNDN